MKSSIIFPAALLLLAFACNNRTGKSLQPDHNSNSTSSPKIRDKTANHLIPPPTAPGTGSYNPATVYQKQSIQSMRVTKQPYSARHSENEAVQKLQPGDVSVYGTIVPLQKRSPTVGHTSPRIVRSEDRAFNTEDYDNIVENTFQNPADRPLSTFSIDVDEAAYTNVRRYLLNGSLPPAGAVRIEEMINYFDYDYPQPKNEDPFSVNTETADCPWNPQHRLVHIGLQGQQIPLENLPNSNLVFLIDVSGSMEDMNKLPLVKSSMKMLVDQLRENDKVAIVVYAGNAGLELPATSGANKIKIKEAIDQLESGGSTAGGEGILLAYKTAKENFITGGNNRIIIATDGDFNVGASSDDDLVTMVEKERKSGVFLSVLGYGMGNYKDNKMQQLADKGNGSHYYIDNINEAKKVLVTEFGGTLFTIAKDVKIQVEFNPEKVQAYRLIGYENRSLADRDFNDDNKDAGELGSGHTVTALYEIIPVGVKNEFGGSIDSLKYQPVKISGLTATQSNELMTVKLRYKKPGEETSKLLSHIVKDSSVGLVSTSDNFRFSAAVAGFGLLLRNSEFKQQATFNQVLSMAKSAKGADKNGYRQEFIQLVGAANSLASN